MLQSGTLNQKHRELILGEDQIKLRTNTPARFVERMPTKMFAPVSHEASSVEKPRATERY